MYWTKNGSIPSQETDGTEGWQEAPAPPTEIPADKELVWLNWEWLIRDPKPADRAGWQWNWNHADRAWVESAWGNEAQPIQIISFEDQAEPTFLFESLATSQISSFTTDQIIALTTSQLG